MKITKITPFWFQMPLESPISDARNTITHRSCVIVRVDTDSGVSGWGEAASFAGCGELVVQTIRFLEKRYLGQDPTMISKLYDESYHYTQHFGRRGLVINALSGIDVALWDILGKVAGLPVYKLLGASRSSINYYFNAGYYIDGDNLAFVEKSVASGVERGAKAVKIKIGRFGLDDDIKRVEVARKVLGKERDLMVDANACLDKRYLRYLDPVLVENRVRWMEEPVPIQHIESLVELRQQMVTPIAGYELEMTLLGYAEMIERRAIDVVQPDAIWSGGLTECHRIAGVAQAHSIELIPHNFASIVSYAANAHLAASAKTGGWLETDSNNNPFLWNVDKNDAYRLEKGTFALPELPGLGIDLDLTRLEAYRMNV